MPNRCAVSRGRRATPRRTARSTIPLASSHVRPKRRATAVGVASRSHAIANRSNRIVNREWGSAYGRRTVLIPCVAH